MTATTCNSKQLHTEPIHSWTAPTSAAKHNLANPELPKRALPKLNTQRPNEPIRYCHALQNPAQPFLYCRSRPEQCTPSRSLTAILGRSKHRRTNACPYTPELPIRSIPYTCKPKLSYTAAPLRAIHLSTHPCRTCPILQRRSLAEPTEPNTANT